MWRRYTQTGSNELAVSNVRSNILILMHGCPSTRPEPSTSTLKLATLKQLWEKLLHLIKFITFVFGQEMKNAHPAPFPLDLIERIVSSTNAKLILDPFMGSGTTALAAKNHGRDFIGIDISPEYCKMAEQRLSNDFALKVTDNNNKQESLFSVLKK